MNYDELETFKSIDLVEFALNHNFEFDKSKGTNGKYIALKKDTINIRVTRVSSGDYLFFDEADKAGNIIHFCNQFLNIKNLGEVRKYLRGFSPSPGVIPTTEPAITNATQRISKEELEKLAEIKKNQYLERERFINVYSKMRYNKVFSDERKNVCFHLRDKDGVCGIFKRGKKDFKAVQGKKGLFVEGNTKASNIVVGEAILDVLSYIQIKELGFTDDTLFIATLGRFSNDVKTYLKIIIENIKNTDLKVIGIFDNDETGIKLFEEIQGILKEIKGKNFTFEKDTSKNKDWNEDLKDLFTENEGKRNYQLRVELLTLANKEYNDKKMVERERKLAEMLSTGVGLSITRIAELLEIDRSTIYRNPKLLELIKSVATR